MKTLILTAAFVVMVGCTHQFYGPELTVTEVKQQWVVTSDQATPAEVYRLLESEKSSLLTYPVMIYWDTPKGKTLAHKARSRLLKLGADNRQITLQQGTEFDTVLVIETRTHQVKAKPCPKRGIAIAEFEPVTQLGCEIEEMRWKSMTHPDAAAKYGKYAEQVQ
ncbi:hypothetical protein NF212_09825 [Parasalinivibrio latis]|uniref:hypothetical protein n=1 Tax=Parasalinivibrio latis TaxID=2952610 RepID=UPI0030E5F30D